MFVVSVTGKRHLRLISSRYDCQRFSPSQISAPPGAWFEPAQNLISNFVESSYAIVIATTLRCHYIYGTKSNKNLGLIKIQIEVKEKRFQCIWRESIYHEIFNLTLNLIP